MISIGARAKTITSVTRRPLYWIPPDKTGTVVRAEKDLDDDEMDEPIEGLEGWRNQVRFTSSDCGMYWWQTWLDTVEKVCRYHFVILPEADT